jgi:dihydroorotate dehydrogenase (fumarate)
MDFSTTYMGLKLRNPLVASSSPLSYKVDGVCRLEEAGIGAVVMHSLFEEQITTESLHLDFFLTHGTDSYAEALSYFPTWATTTSDPMSTSISSAKRKNR